MLLLWVVSVVYKSITNLVGTLKNINESLGSLKKVTILNLEAGRDLKAPKEILLNTILFIYCCILLKCLPFIQEGWHRIPIIHVSMLSVGFMEDMKLHITKIYFNTMLLVLLWKSILPYLMMYLRWQKICIISKRHSGKLWLEPFYF